MALFKFRGESTPLTQIDFYACLIAVMMFGFHLLARTGLNDSFNILPLALSISILLLPSAFERVWNFFFPLVQFIVLLIFFGLGWLSIFQNVNFGALLIVVSIGSLVAVFGSYQFRVDKLRVIGLFFVILFAFKLMTVMWASYFMAPLAPEAYARGHLHIDTLYLATLAAMTKTYQTVTTGLFGLVPIEYHAGTSYLFASFSQLCKMGTLEFFNFGYPVIFGPLFFQSFLRTGLSNLNQSINQKKLTISILTFVALLGGYVNNDFGYEYLMTTTLNNFWLSQSYCVSLILSFLFIYLYMPLLKKDYLSENKTVNTILIFIIPVWIFVIGYTKVSTGCVLAAVTLWVMFRRLLVFRWTYFTAMVLSIIALWIILQITIEKSRDNFVFFFGAFFKYYVHGNVLLFLLLAYLWIFILVAIVNVVLRVSKKKRSKELSNGNYVSVDSGAAIVFFNRSPKYLMFEVLFVAAIAGILPGLLFEIEGGSAGYFLDFQNWLAALAIVAFVPFLVFKFYYQSKRARLILTISLVLISAAVIRENFFKGFYILVKQNLGIRASLMYNNLTKFSLSNTTIDHPAFIGGKLNTGQLLTILRDCRYPLSSPKFNKQLEPLNLPLMNKLRQLPHSVKRASLLYCEDIALLPSFKDCGQSFYIQSLTEIALVNGLYWKDCLPSGEYSFRYYKAYPAQITFDEAVARARENGFENIIKVSLNARKFDIIKI